MKSLVLTTFLHWISPTIISSPYMKKKAPFWYVLVPISTISLWQLFQKARLFCNWKLFLFLMWTVYLFEFIHHKNRAVNVSIELLNILLLIIGLTQMYFGVEIDHPIFRILFWSLFNHSMFMHCSTNQFSDQYNPIIDLFVALRLCCYVRPKLIGIYQEWPNLLLCVINFNTNNYLRP